MRLVTGRRAFTLVLGVMAAMSYVTGAAAKFKVLYNFCSQANCADGGAPIAGLTGDGNGNFYGITDQGGSSAAGSGTIFKLAKNGKSYAYQVLHIVDCTNSCPDGENASGELVLDSAGNLYGMMSSGGASNGTLFQLSAGGQYRVLHNFCGGDCSDGAFPSSQLTYVGANTNALYDGISPLYGAAKFGGVYGGGTTFSATPDGTVQVLFGFCAPKKCKSGKTLQGSVAVGGAGTIYGANFLDTGQQPGGALWSVGPVDLLHHFCDTAPCKDGVRPTSGIFLSADSPIVFGTTAMGGAGNQGVAYKVDISGKPYSILHTFCKSGQPCKDGSSPSSTLYPDDSGGVLGTTMFGGNVSQFGTLYRIDLATKKLRTLYNFCKQDLCLDGAAPVGHVVQYGGSVFGVTSQGGSSSTFSGVIYQYTP